MGLFQALSMLELDTELRPEDRALLAETYDWFKQSLLIPTRFARSSRPHAHHAAISWFKDTAAEHIERMRTVAKVLDAYGYHVEMLKTSRPGFIVYEDEHQVAAEPFADTPA